jgi:hypothetical protein
MRELNNLDQLMLTGLPRQLGKELAGVYSKVGYNSGNIYLRVSRKTPRAGV